MLFYISILAHFYGCSSGKQVATFSKEQKSITKLTLLTPYTFIEVFDESTVSLDKVLAENLSGHILARTIGTLNEKYQLENKDFLPFEGEMEKITSFFHQLDSFNKELPEIKLPEWLQNRSSGDSSRYILATFLFAYYHSAYEPYYMEKNSTNVYFIVKPHLEWVGMKVLLADRIKNRILFYNADDSYESDPRITSDVDIMLRKLIQPIYYK